MKLEPHEVRYRIEWAGSGYRFDVEALLDQEWGWQATVVMNSHGLKTPEAAVMALKGAAEAFLKALSETEGKP